MRLILAVLLASFVGSALADTPLFDSSTPQWSYEDAVLSDRLKAEPSAKKVVALTLNRAAFNDEAITVSVNNKIYRFVGKVTRFAATPKVLTWSGTEKSSMFNRLSISIDEGNGGVFGRLDVGELHFTIHGAVGSKGTTPTVFFVERGDSGAPPMID